MRAKALVRPQRVIDQRHEKVGDTASGVAPATDQSIASTNHILVEEACRPDLTWDEGAA